MELIRWLSVSSVFLVPGVYLFNYHIPLLIRVERRRCFTYVAAALAVIGVLQLFVLGNITEARVNAVGLISPIFHIYFFRAMYAFFLSRFGREPKDVYNDWTPGLWPDRIFAMTVWIGATIWFFTFLYLADIGLSSLGK